MSNERLNLLISAPEGFEIIGTIPHSYMNDESCLIVRYDIKRTDSIAIKPNPHAALIEQCEDDKRLYPDFWDDLYQWKNSDGEWCSFGKNWIQAQFKSDFEYRQHPHRASIIEWHTCSDAGKLRWECKKIDVPLAMWCQTGHSGVMEWREDYEYRMKPKVCQITIGGKVFEYPEPVRNPLEDKQVYFTVNVFGDCIDEYKWGNDSCDIEWLSLGQVHLTEQAAQQHLEVLQAVNAQVAL